MDPAVSVLFKGPDPYAAFDRPLPLAVETSVFQDFEGYFNQTQARRVEDRGYGVIVLGLWDEKTELLAPGSQALSCLDSSALNL